MYETTYHRPKSLSEAASLFSGAGDATYISGGHTLLPAMKARLAGPADLIDLRHVPELKGIQASGDTVTIGAAMTHAQVAQSADVKNAISTLAALAGSIGDAQVRHLGTIGGSVANNDPAADYPAAVLALGGHGPHRQAADRRRPVFHRPLYDRAGGGRDRHPRCLQDSGNERLREVPQPGLALSDGRRVRREAQGRLGPRGGDRGGQ